PAPDGRAPAAHPPPNRAGGRRAGGRLRRQTARGSPALSAHSGEHVHERPDDTQHPELQVWGVRGIGEVRPGDDLAALIVDAAAQGHALASGDVLVVTQKIVSKAEGRLVDLATVEPSAFARQWAADYGKDPRHVEVVLRESRRIVKMDRGVLVAETHHGFVCANAGVDASNVPGHEVLTLLP